jgi:hypothetical protein
MSTVLWGGFLSFAPGLRVSRAISLDLQQPVGGWEQPGAESGHGGEGHEPGKFISTGLQGRQVEKKVWFLHKALCPSLHFCCPMTTLEMVTNVYLLASAAEKCLPKHRVALPDPHPPHVSFLCSPTPCTPRKFMEVRGWGLLPRFPFHLSPFLSLSLFLSCYEETKGGFSFLCGVA